MWLIHVGMYNLNAAVQRPLILHSLPIQQVNNKIVDIKIEHEARTQNKLYCCLQLTWLLTTRSFPAVRLCGGDFDLIDFKNVRFYLWVHAAILGHVLADREQPANGGSHWWNSDGTYIPLEEEPAVRLWVRVPAWKATSRIFSGAIRWRTTIC